LPGQGCLQANTNHDGVPAHHLVKGLFGPGRLAHSSMRSHNRSDHTSMPSSPRSGIQTKRRAPCKGDAGMGGRDGRGNRRGWRADRAGLTSGRRRCIAPGRIQRRRVYWLRAWRARALTVACCPGLTMQNQRRGWRIDIRPTSSTLPSCLSIYVVLVRKSLLKASVSNCG
jgi:hypothetical protein